MPILAAYWGAECKYDTPRGRLNVIFNHSTVHLFSQENINAKLCLRPLWSITEHELRDLGNVLNIERIEVVINHLRAKGFCVDQELVDAGLVEWKQTN